MHTKVLIADDTVLTGSYNYPENATYHSDENFLIIRDKEVLEAHLRKFNVLWGEEPLGAPPEVKDEKEGIEMATVLNLVQIVALVFLMIYVVKTWQLASSTKRMAQDSNKTLVETRLLREGTILKQAYDYIRETHNSRVVIYENERTIKGVNSLDELKGLKKEISDAVHAVAHCYHYIGFLTKYGLLSNKSAIFEETGDTFLHLYNVIRPVIQQERERMHKPTYKQYLEYLKREIDQYKNRKRKERNGS